MRYRGGYDRDDHGRWDRAGNADDRDRRDHRRTDDTTGEPSDTTASASGATGGTVRIGYGGSPDSLNPGLGLLAEAYIMYELVYDTPISIDLDGNYVPELAEEWSVSDDGLTWTLDLVEGATFHDGTPLTAEDVKYSLELWRDTEDFPYLPAYGDVFEEIEAPDEQTVTITLTDPVGNFESRMVFMYIVPKAIWEAVEDPVAFDNAEMIGSGPFKLAEYRQGEFVRLEANDDYWAAPPNVDEVIFQTIENADARVTALTTGQADMITEFPKTAVATLRNDPNITVVSGEPLSPSLVDIFFNLVEPERCPEDGVCSGHPALRDLAVRTALAHAVDKQQMIDVVLLGLGTPGLSLLAPGYGPYFNSEMQDYAFDIAEANRILDEAGYVDEDGDGVRECLPDQDCDDLTFRFNFNTDADTAPREAELALGMVGGDRRGPPDPGTRRRHSDLGVLSHIRLRHHPLELGRGSRPGLPVGHRVVRRARHRVVGNGLLQRGVRPALCRPGDRDRPRGAPRDHLGDAGDPDAGPPLHHPLLRPDGAGVPQRHLHRLAGFGDPPRTRGSDLPHRHPASGMIGAGHG